MIVEEIMHTELHTLLPTDTVRDALRIMRLHRVRHLPVVNEQRNVIGVVTERTIKEAMPSRLQEEPNPSSIFDTSIEKIMMQDPIIAHPLDFVEDIALTFYESRIGCVPIVSGGKLVGIVTSTDLLYTYIELTGANTPGSKIDIRVSDKPGTLYEITKVIKDHHTNVQSVLVFPDSDNKENRILSVRVQTLNPLSIINDLREEGFDVLWPNLPGIKL